MSEQAVLREFLVTLGFQVDAASEAKFREAAEGADKRMKAFAGTLTVASAALSAYLTAATSKLNGLAISSSRIGASANNITSFQYAVQQMGGSAQAALQSLDGMAQKMRDMPGYKGIFTQFGIDPDKEKDNVESLLKLFNSDKFKAQSYPTQKAFADKLGIDDQTFRMLLDPATLEAYQKHNSYLDKMGVNLDESSKGARELSQAIGELYAKLEGPAMKVAGDMAGDFAEGLRAVNAQLDVLSDWYSKLPEESKQTIETFAKWAGYASAIVGSLGALKMAGSVLKMLPSGGGAGGGAAAGPGLLASLGWIGAAGGSGYYAGSKIYEQLSDQTKDAIGGTIASILAKFGNEEAQRALDVNLGGGSSPVKVKPAPAPAKSQPAAESTHERFMRLFMSFGWTKEQAAGIVANLKVESGFNHRAIGDSGTAYGLAQWHPPRQADFRKWSGKDIRDSTEEEQARFLHYEITQGAERRAGELLKMARNAIEAGQIVSRHIERPKLVELEARKRGELAAQIHQTTHITVNGAADPRATASAISDAQRGVNNDIVRNYKTAAR